MHLWSVVTIRQLEVHETRRSQEKYIKTHLNLIVFVEVYPLSDASGEQFVFIGLRSIGFTGLTLLALDGNPMSRY